MPPIRRAHRQLFASLATFAFTLTVAFSQTAFTPNDPYFHSGTNAGLPTGYYGSWHLVNQMPVSSVNAGLDVNILGAWARGLTGSGVIIGILDNGMQADHPDLASKFVNAYSWDFGRTQAENIADTFRGQPVLTEDNHGTAVAGVAAATGGNALGLTGTAPYALVASQRVFGFGALPDDHTQDEYQAASILYQGQLDANGQPDPYTAPDWNTVPIRVKNHSYGVSVAYASQPNLTDALAESASHGVIHIVSAGNQAVTYTNPWPTEDATKASLSGSKDVITVSSLDSTGKKSIYSSYGANIFVTALSDGSENEYFIATTDRTTKTFGYNGADPYFTTDGDYASDFGGTSSAAPLVSGIMALGVEARPDLDIRLAKHALALTSRTVDASDSSWVTNAAGYHFSNKYGFGLIDADAFTMSLQSGLAISSGQVAREENIAVNRTFSNSTSLLENYVANFDNALPLEYVKVSLTINGLKTDWTDYTENGGSIMGDFSAWITSPDNTRYQLFFDDRNIPDEYWESRRSYSSDTLAWDFTSYAYWGESLNGLWTIELSNFALDAGVTWENFSFEAGQGRILVVPEPSTGMLVAIGFLFLLRRRSRR